MSNDASYWQNFVGPVAAALITSTLTLGGIGWQLSRQEAHAERVRFIDGAQATAQETSRLLNDGYNELAKMTIASHNKGWKEFSASSWADYMAFHRRWREQLIVEHFKLIRYFGKHMADDLIHVDEIDLHPVSNLSSPNPCMPSGGKGDLDIAKLAYVTECTTRMAAVTQDVIDDGIAHKTDDGIMSSIQEHSRQENFESQLLEDYEKSTVRYLRVLDDTLTQLGDPQVTVVTRGTGA